MSIAFKSTKQCGDHGDCECNQFECTPCGKGSFSRPRFFAGQLLTEEDLQALTSYTVDKNRLHNRYLFGDGVVCGLEVKPHPCGKGIVIVEPGYAINCCGDDILVPCRHDDIDILAMIRELRRRLNNGYDCGDPCADADGNPNDTGRKPGEDREYCLYVNYCEEGVDPVSPYGTQDCSESACEFSQIREGYKFELRCPIQESDINPIAQLLKCLGPLKTAKHNIASVRNAWQKSARLHHAHSYLSSGKQIEFTAADMDVISKSIRSLEQTTARLASDTDVSRVQLAFEDLLLSSAAITRFRIHAERSGEVAKEFAERIAESTKAVEEIIGAIEESKLQSVLTNEHQVTAAAVRQQSRKWISGNATTEASFPREREYFALNAPFSLGMATELLKGSNLPQARQWLLDHLDSAHSYTERQLRDTLASTTMPLAVMQNPGDFLQFIGLMLTGIINLIRNCLCKSLIPPCPDCTDHGVLLACLTVRDCEIVDICNLERKFIAAPGPVRYWNTPGRFVKQLLEYVCCQMPKAIENIVRQTPGRQTVWDITGLMPGGELFLKEVNASRSEVEPILRFTGLTREQIPLAADLINDVGVLVRDSRLFEAIAEPNAAMAVSADFLKSVTGSGARSSGRRRSEIDDLLKIRVGEVIGDLPDSVMAPSAEDSETDVSASDAGGDPQLMSVLNRLVERAVEEQLRVRDEATGSGTGIKKAPKKKATGKAAPVKKKASGATTAMKKKTAKKKRGNKKKNT